MKKDNKAFTLIEIIAVIVLIGIIILIIGIPVTKYVENSKKKIYQSHERDLEVAAKNYMIECLSNDEDNCTIPTNKDHVELDYNTLVSNGYSDEIEDPDGDGYCDESYVITENNSQNGVDLIYKPCLICSQYKTDESWCVADNLSCELEVVGTSENGWYKSDVTVKLKYQGEDITSFGMNNDLTTAEYNGKTSLIVSNNGVTQVAGHIKNSKGKEAHCSVDVKIDMDEPEGLLYMGYEVYPKETTTINNNSITINNLSKYGTISGVIVEFSNNLTISIRGEITSNGVSIKTDGAFLTGRNNAIFTVSPGTYDNITINLGSNSITSLLSKVRLLKQENETSVWTNKDVALYVDASDSITGVNEYSYDNKVTFVNSNIKTFSSNTSSTVVLKDAYGNTSNGYNYVISKIDKVVPTIDLDYSIDKTSSGSLYISKINYDGKDTFGEVDSVEYIEKTSKDISSTDTGSKIINTSSKNYTSVLTNNYVFFRAIDKAGNESEWILNNRYIGNIVTIESYDTVNVGSIGDTYNLVINNCSNSKCDKYDSTVTLLPNSRKFYVSNYGNDFYEMAITSDYNDINISRKIYLHNFMYSSGQSKNNSVYIVDNSNVTDVDEVIKDPKCTSASATISYNYMNFWASGSAYSNCPSGQEYDSTKGVCVYEKEYGTNTYQCALDPTSNELRLKYISETYNVSCMLGGTKVFICDYDRDGYNDEDTPYGQLETSCSSSRLEKVVQLGENVIVNCYGWCEKQLDPQYQYTVGIFVK